MFPANPVRDLWFDVTIPGNHGSRDGNPVSLAPFAGPITVLVTAGSTLSKSVTVTFEGTTEDPSSPGNPLASGWAPIKKGGFCEEEEALSIAIVHNVDPFKTERKLICRELLPCPVQFVRAKLSSTHEAISVHVIGKARRLVEA